MDNHPPNTNASAPIRFFALACVLLLSACTPDPPTPATETAGGVDRPTVGSNAELPQLVAMPDQTLKLVWVAREQGVVNVYVSGWGADDDGFAPVRINTDGTPHSPIVIDEMRPAIAVAPPARLAVAWTDEAYDIQLAVSENGGETFSAPIRVNQDSGEALQEFPSLAYDGDGILHAAWLDPRLAPEVVEEPADLFYARIDGTIVSETNLTIGQDSSVCGCCLPDLRISGDAIRITFRNTMNGYRDPYQVAGNTDGAFGAPLPVTAPVWEIDACPVAGPIGVGPNALWLDGSTGVRRLLESQGEGTEPRVVFEDTEDWRLNLPPRRVEGTLDSGTLYLIPAEPSSVIVRKTDQDEWETLAEDLPGWVTDGALIGSELYLVGTSGGRFVESRQEWR